MTSKTIRLRALTKLFGGVIAFGLVLFGVVIREVEHERQAIFRLIAMATPGSLAFIGLIELTTGKPFTQLASSWAALKWWHRLWLGLAIAVAFFMLLFFGVYLCLKP